MKHDLSRYPRQHMSVRDWALRTYHVHHCTPGDNGRRGVKERVHFKNHSDFVIQGHPFAVGQAQRSSFIEHSV